MAKILDASDIAHGIEDLAQGARARGLRIVLIGGAALQLMGSDRLTRDVDIAATDQAAMTLLRRPRALAIGGVTGKTESGIPADVVVRGDDYRELYESAVAGATKRGGVSIPVATPDHLVAMKMVAARPKDQADLMFLLASKHVNLKRAKMLARTYLGPYAADELDRLIDEAAWRATRRKDRS